MSREKGSANSLRLPQATPNFGVEEMVLARERQGIKKQPDARLEHLLAAVTDPLQRKALIMTLGLIDGHKEPIDQIAKRTHLTKEEVRESILQGVQAMKEYKPK